MLTILQRYNDKVEEERQAVLQAQEQAAAKKRAEQDAQRKADEANKPQAKENGDTEMPDLADENGDAMD
jgi:heat shock protein 4